MDAGQFYIYINRGVLPVLLTGLFFYIQFNRQLVAEWLGRIKKGKSRLVLGYILMLEYLNEGLTVKLEDLKKTIILPVALAIGLDILVSWTYQVPLHASGEVLWFALLTGGFLNPISEEFLVRGIGLGVFIHLAERISDRLKKGEPVKYGIYLFGLLFISYIFTINHANYTTYQFVSRFMQAMLYGSLYLFGGRNLLPPMIAHAAHNLFLILNDELGA
jgi:membrane protease YdiL (CAAX protease family)